MREERMSFLVCFLLALCEGPPLKANYFLALRVRRPPEPILETIHDTNVSVSHFQPSGTFLSFGRICKTKNLKRSSVSQLQCASEPTEKGGQLIRKHAM